MKLEKIAVVLSSIALLFSLAVFVSQQIPSILNPRIFCSAIEHDSTDRYYSDHSPAYSYAGSISLGVSVTNNVTSTLYNLHVEVSYKTSLDTWSTISKNIGILDIEQTKETRIYLTIPKLWGWDFNETIGDDPFIYRLTRYVLNATDYKITAYGFTRP